MQNVKDATEIQRLLEVDDKREDFEFQIWEVERALWRFKCSC